MISELYSYYCVAREIKDPDLDYIPFISTVTNLSYIFEKIRYSLLREIPAQENQDYTFLQAKSFTRCFIALIPIVGNIFLRFADSGSTLFAHSKFRHDAFGYYLKDKYSNFAVINGKNLVLELLKRINPCHSTGDHKWFDKVDPTLKDDPHVMGFAMNKDPFYFIDFAGPNFKNNPTLIKKFEELLVKKYPGLNISPEKYMGEDLRKNIHLRCELLKSNSYLIRWAEDEIKSNQDCVRSALYGDSGELENFGWNSLMFASQELKKDLSFLCSCVGVGSESKHFHDNPSMLKKLRKQQIIDMARRHPYSPIDLQNLITALEEDMGTP